MHYTQKHEWFDPKTTLTLVWIDGTNWLSVVESIMPTPAEVALGQEWKFGTIERWIEDRSATVFTEVERIAFMEVPTFTQVEATVLEWLAEQHEREVEFEAWLTDWEEVAR